MKRLDIYIIARVESEDAEHKLRRAGAELGGPQFVKSLEETIAA